MPVMCDVFVEHYLPQSFDPVWVSQGDGITIKEKYQWKIIIRKYEKSGCIMDTEQISHNWQM